MEEQDHSHHDHHEHAHQEHHDAQAHAAHPAPEAKREKVFEINSNLIFAILVIAILAVTIYARLGLVKSQGLFEPDGFFYYSVIRATLGNHLIEPQYLGISGFPVHNFIGEAPGLPYITVIFYLLLGWSGAGYLTIMRYLPLFFGLVELVLAYFIAKELSDSRLCGLLAMLFIGVSAGNIARTAALVYRGDSFIAVPLMFALLLLLKGLKLKNVKAMALVALFAAFVLSTGIMVWNGAQYIVAVYMLSLVLLIVYAFISWKPELMKAVLVFTAGLFALYLLQNIYVYLHGARLGIVLQGNGFLPFYLPLLALAVLAFWFMRRGRIGLLHSSLGRTIAAIVVIAIVAVAIAVVFRGYIGIIANVAGISVGAAQNQTIGTAVGATTQELQKPSFQFLFASFELELYLVFIGALAFAFLIRDKIIAWLEGSRRRALWVGVAVVELALLVVLYLLNGLHLLPGFFYTSRNLVVYLLVLIDLLIGFYLARSGAAKGANRQKIVLVGLLCLWLLVGWATIWHYMGSWQMPLYLTLFSFLVLGVAEYGDKSLEGDLNVVPYIAMISYLLVTAYLQYNAIRYNSLLSIPIAIFAAYGLFIIIEAVGRIRITNQTIKYLFAIAALVVLILLAWFWMRNIITTGQGYHNNWYLLEGYGSLLIMVVLLAMVIVPIVKGGKLELKKICLIAAVFVILFCTVFTIIESYASAQADGINTSFLSAMVWLKNNTATNATVLALWPDGSVVEGWGNRTSYMDSVGGENATRIYYFARYLENSSADSQYLYNIGKPQYLVARQYWLTELSGLVAEGVPQNQSAYTFTPLGQVASPQQNATAQFYFLGNGYYNVTLINTKPTNTLPANYTAYLGTTGQGKLYKIARVTLYNTSDGYYMAYNASAYQFNYTLMVFYSGSQIQGSIIMTSGLYESNLFKLIWLCTAYQCPYYSNSSARITPVYTNNDTRIFRINYTH